MTSNALLRQSVSKLIQIIPHRLRHSQTSIIRKSAVVMPVILLGRTRLPINVRFRSNIQSHLAIPCEELYETLNFGFLC